MQDNYSIDLLGFEGVRITKVIRSEKEIKVYAETKASRQTCPLCGASVRRIHDYRDQVIKDLPIHLKPVNIILKKRRYRCTCGKRFYESYPFLPKYLHRTTRLTKGTAHLFKDAISIRYAAKEACSICSAWDQFRW